ncbi:hypothetical protein BO70DRAFT_359930 [Aspergillus heteromorphus CBS 117.55]|uniref:Uncharacterized protein n=1 Tax=Aspergillus heteromorphus CBS 117.55 TaxID=1448321 RepID=A0A317WTG1_9EURO|nr:uncharacterized protein BO70DRAFT_359930 [Aspergillus heteromorphus CBS 117.55]PWY88477.1 hypothetical protein BO70DRAFT_359930 [Aspergillus heteromorphus CBS 117.55]
MTEYPAVIHGGYSQGRDLDIEEDPRGNQSFENGTYDLIGGRVLGPARYQELASNYAEWG